jgi:hypothetical protein
MPLLSRFMIDDAPGTYTFPMPARTGDRVLDEARATIALCIDGNLPRLTSQLRDLAQILAALQVSAERSGKPFDPLICVNVMFERFGAGAEYREQLAESIRAAGGTPSKPRLMIVAGTDSIN